jgi:four helix bundle protein
MRRSDIEFKRFLRVALGSLNEVVTALYISRDEQYLTQHDFEVLYEESNKVASKIHALIKSL